MQQTLKEIMLHQESVYLGITKEKLVRRKSEIDIAWESFGGWKAAKFRSKFIDDFLDKQRRR